MQTNPNSKRTEDRYSLLFHHIVSYIDAKLKLSDFKKLSYKSFNSSRLTTMNQCNVNHFEHVELQLLV